MSAVLAPSIRILRLADVMAATGLRKSSIYALAARNKFPRPFKITPTNSSGWSSVDIEQFVRDRVATAQQLGADNGK